MQIANGYVSMQKTIPTLKEDKAALAAEGYPAFKVKALVDSIMKEKIVLPENAVLYVAPSTSGYNKIPAAVARKLKETNPTAEIVEDYARARHLTKSAHKTAIDKLNDPVRWEFKRELEPSGRPAYIVEDVVTTGESTRALREELASRGITVNGAISLQQGETKEMYASDYKRLFTKLDANKDLQADVREVMDGQLRRKAGVIEAAITHGTEDQKNEIKTYFRNEGRRLRTLDPGTRKILREFGAPGRALQHGQNRKTGNRQGY